MSDEKLKQELLYMVKLASKYDFSKMEVVESILRLENERKILNSVFGARFKTRIFDIAAGVDNDGKCVICGQSAENKVVCAHCIETISGSQYAQSKIKNEKVKRKFNFNRSKFKFLKVIPQKLKSIKLLKKQKQLEDKPEAKRPVEVSKKDRVKTFVKYCCLVCFILLLFVQLWILSIWISLSDYPKKSVAYISKNQPTAIESAEDATSQLALEYPESQGYSIIYGRNDIEYAGRFTVELGESCEKVEEKLSEEERYDYYLPEEVYICYITSQEPHLSKVGVAEINKSGNIIVLGFFNDGRETNEHYRIK